MSKTKNHTLDTVCRMLDGSWGEGDTDFTIEDDGSDNYMSWLTSCNNMCLLNAFGPTRAAAIAALEAKLRECAMAVLSDEWEFGQ